MHANRPPTQKGFTLIELIVGITVFAVALLILTSFFAPQAKRGIDSIYQVRATKLAQSLLNEIGNKAFDEGNLGSGVEVSCQVSSSCTTSALLGPDGGESRDSFDDVDDYHGLTLNDSQIVGLLGGSIDYFGQDIYTGFRAQISVVYDANQDGLNDDDADNDGNLDSGTLRANRKLIQVSIFTPDNEVLRFASFRSNY